MQTDGYKAGIWPRMVSFRVNLKYKHKICTERWDGRRQRERVEEMCPSSNKNPTTWESNPQVPPVAACMWGGFILKVYGHRHSKPHVDRKQGLVLACEKGRSSLKETQGFKRRKHEREWIAAALVNNCSLLHTSKTSKFSTIHFYGVFIYLSERGRTREWVNPKWLQWPGLGQEKPTAWNSSWVSHVSAGATAFPGPSAGSWPGSRAARTQPAFWAGMLMLQVVTTHWATTAALFSTILDQISKYLK